MLTTPEQSAILVVSNRRYASTSTLKQQREEFETMGGSIMGGFEADDMDAVNDGLQEMAKFLGVELEYSNTDEFCDYMDTRPTISL